MYTEHVDVPVDAILTNKNLNHLDILTYLTIRSFQDRDTNKSSCSVEEVASLMGVKIISAHKSIERLTNAGFLIANNTGRRSDKIFYNFKLGLKTIQIPFEILATELSNHLKSCLIIMRTLLSTVSADRDLFIEKVREIERLKPETDLFGTVVWLTGLRFAHIEVPKIGNPFWQLTDKLHWNDGKSDLALANASIHGYNNSL